MILSTLMLIACASELKSGLVISVLYSVDCSNLWIVFYLQVKSIDRGSVFHRLFNFQ
jgi:hypothetical protein